MRELTPTYEGKAEFSVIEGSMEETQKRWADVGMKDDTHGLVGMSGGEVAVQISGHQFTKNDLVAKIEELLSK